VFDVPEKWKADMDAVLGGNIKGTSKEYKELLYRVFPKLKEKFDQMFA
jgi:hypothetical protein